MEYIRQIYEFQATTTASLVVDQHHFQLIQDCYNSSQEEICLFVLLNFSY